MKCEQCGRSDVSRGVLVYDVPDAAKLLYSRIRRLICWKHAVMVNRSVYLIDWGAKPEIERIIEEQRKDTNQTADISILPFDESAHQVLQDMAHRALTRMLVEMRSNLRGRLLSAKERIEASEAECRKKGADGLQDPEKAIKSKQRRIVLDAKKKLELAKGLSLVFGMTDELSHAMDAANQVVGTELTLVELVKKPKKLATAVKDKFSPEEDL